MSDHLVPPDSLYKSAPYTDLGMYDYLNGTGKFLLNLADISNLDGTYDRTCSKAYTQDYIDTTISMLEPTVTALKNSGSCFIRLCECGCAVCLMAHAPIRNSRHERSLRVRL